MKAITTANPGIFQVFGKQLNQVTGERYKTSTKIITGVAIALIALSIAGLIATGVAIVPLASLAGAILAVNITVTVVAIAIISVALRVAVLVISCVVLSVKLAKLLENLNEPDVSGKSEEQKNAALFHKLTTALTEGMNAPEKILNAALTTVPLKDYPTLEITECSEIATLKRDDLVTEIEFADRSTMESIIEQANQDQESEIIAINYANEYHGGGGPGMGPLGNKIVRYASRCRAQEEEMVTTTDFLPRIANLTNKFPVLSMMRLYTGDARGFSKKGKCLIGRVFAFGSNKNASNPITLAQQPVPFTVVASAAQCLKSNNLAMRKFAQIRSQDIVGLKDDAFFDEMKKRIRAHLTAAANTPVTEGEQRVLITGAFGCGAFAPRYKGKIDPKYVQVIAALYKDFLEDEFTGYFDKVIMAVPNFGLPDKPDVCHQIFKEIFTLSEEGAQ